MQGISRVLAVVPFNDMYYDDGYDYDHLMVAMERGPRCPVDNVGEISFFVAAKRKERDET